MRFVVGDQRPSYDGEPTFQLVKDNWNDWFKWYTLYAVRAILSDDQIVDLGHVKIGRQGMTEDNGTELPRVYRRVKPSEDTHYGKEDCISVFA